MKATISLDGILSFIRSLSLNANNKRWLAEKLLEEARLDDEAKTVSTATTLYGAWSDEDFPDMTAEDLAAEIKSTRKFKNHSDNILR